MFFHFEVPFRFITCLHCNPFCKREKIIQTTKPKRRDWSCILIDLNLKDYFWFSFAEGQKQIKSFLLLMETAFFHCLNKPVNLIYSLPDCEPQLPISTSWVEIEFIMRMN